VTWLLGRQNADGGWGESPRSYRRPELAGVAPSMAPVTGVVLAALCDVGLGRHPATERGARYLLDRQRSDGSWDSGGYVAGQIPPDAFYELPAMDPVWPLEGLARVLHDDGPPAPRSTLPEPLRDEFLDRMRRHGDPEADAAAAALVQAGGDTGAIFQTVALAAGPAPQPPPPVLADYFARTAALPDWADPAKILTAQRLFARYGWEVALSLFCVALPQGYCSGPCARCVGRTKSLTQAARRRVFETAQFLFDVLDEGGLSPAGRGVRACQVVRLKHAVLRRLLADGQDVERDGNPVNQDDLQGTLLLFTVAPLDVLRKLELPVSADDAEAWAHTWSVIGHLLGIDARLLPRTVADAEVRLMAFRRRHWEATPEGRALARALVELMQGYYPEAFAQVPVALIRCFAGPSCAELLGLPKVDWSGMAVQTGRWLSGQWAGGHLHGSFQRIAGAMTQHVMKGLFLLQTTGQLNWAELLTEATRALGLLAPGGDGATEGRSAVRHLTYWLMKGLVLAGRDGQPAQSGLPAASIKPSAVAGAGRRTN
jgi:hypothetical protein